MVQLGSNGGLLSLLVQTLYKYVSAERALTCLPEVGDGTLRATQPAALNDPFECVVVQGAGYPDYDTEIQSFVDVLTKLNEQSPVTFKDVSAAREKFGSLYLRELLAKQLSTRFGIVSFSTDPRHPLMWSHYTTDGSGFVIGYAAQSLRLLAKAEGMLRAVMYSKEIQRLYGFRIVTDPPENLYTLLSLKSDHWQYEDEWRLIVELEKTIGTGKRDRHGQPINLIQVPNPAVVSVHFSERTPAKAVNSIQARLANPNNRYGTTCVTKLIASEEHYGYEDGDHRSTLEVF